MAMAWSNGNTALNLRAFFSQGGGQAIGERMVEVRIQVSRSRVHHGSQILPVQNRVDVFGFLFPLPRLFCHQLRQAQVGYMLSFVSHPYHHDVEFWSRQISSFALHAARAAVLEGRGGFLMDVGIRIRMVDRFPWSIFYRGAELVDETLILSSDGGFGEADEPANEFLMIPSEESAGSRGEFGGVPASKSSINALETRNFQEHESASACVIAWRIWRLGWRSRRCHALMSSIARASATGWRRATSALCAAFPCRLWAHEFPIERLELDNRHVCCS